MRGPGCSRDSEEASAAGVSELGEGEGGQKGNKRHIAWGLAGLGPG